MNWYYSRICNSQVIVYVYTSGECQYVSKLLNIDTLSVSNDVKNKTDE